jgi:hypothetical protein
MPLIIICTDTAMRALFMKMVHTAEQWLDTNGGRVGGVDELRYSVAALSRRLFDGFALFR